MTDEQLGIILFLTSFFSGCIGLVGGCVLSWIDEIKGGGLNITKNRLNSSDKRKKEEEE